jgi:hypothetical protein
MPDVHAQSVDEENERTWLDGGRMRPSGVACGLQRCAEPPRKWVNPGTIESSCGPRDDVFARSCCGDRLN